MDNITKEEFATMVRQELKERNPDWNIHITNVPKVNGVVLTGLIILSNKSNIAPTVYLESFYENYKVGRTLKSITDKIECLCEEHNVDDVCFDMKEFLNFEKVKKGLCLKVINAERNKDMLQDIPHRYFHDLAIVYYILLPNEAWLHGMASILVNNRILEYWECAEDDIYKIAYRNTQNNFNYVIRPIQEVLLEIACEDTTELLDIDAQSVCDTDIMYYASNMKKYNGASILLYDDFLKRFAEKHGEFYILPSSIDEVLFVPITIADLDVSRLCAMVSEINEDCLETEKFLSNNVYLFHSETQSLKIITK